MKNRMIFAFSLIGIVIGLVSAYFFGIETKAQAPVFNPAPNPYEKGIYANGIVESSQLNGQNINLYPEVSGTVTRILVNEGDAVRAGTPLLAIDDSVQRATVAQQKSQVEAASTLLQALRAQPRKEALAVSKAQLDLAGANLKTAQDQFDKQQHSYDIEPRSVSKDALDSARNASNAARANLDVAQKQYDLTRAGAWVYDIDNQQRQVEALSKAYEASGALLEKYTLKAPVDGVVLSLNIAVGSYASPQGVYSTYTQGAAPAIVMGGSQDYFNVRCYIDEILISRLPPPDKISAQMSIRGTDVKISLEFVRVQPYVSPKIALSDQRQERVDLRVLPVIFRFAGTGDLKIYPGQLVDVYVGQK
ncbi:MAG TPA: biotin/lipoyl-binding protein [Burkholderiaceae bacterium]|nr:biotin/lipoyl-binding protein [Burkholderiaceae bacterium]